MSPASRRRRRVSSSPCKRRRGAPPAAAPFETGQQWADERHAFAALLKPSDSADRALAASPFTPTLRDEILGLAYHAGSDLLLLPVQDAFGWRDRINTPATVGDWNWTWRLPWPVDALVDTLPAMERAAFSEALAKRTMRG